MSRRRTSWQRGGASRRRTRRGHVASSILSSFFFFNDTATTEIYTLSLHDALPISRGPAYHRAGSQASLSSSVKPRRSEEHTSELQSHSDLVCRLLLEKKKKTK